MKKVVVALMLIAAVTACGQRGNNTAQNVASVSSDPNVVNVLYFHPEQGCATCKAVGAVSKKLIETEFAGKKVEFVDVDFSVAANKNIVEKYEIVSSSLIIAKGNDKIDLTQQAFATALSNPQALENLIKETITNYELSITNYELI
jgi:hypothetical protein